MLNYNIISLIFWKDSLGQRRDWRGYVWKEGAHVCRKLLHKQEMLVAFLLGMEEWKDPWNVGMVAWIELWDLLHVSHGLKEKGKTHI